VVSPEDGVHRERPFALLHDRHHDGPLWLCIFTDVIGVQAIFGVFLAGLIVPREGSLAIPLTEKLEDMVSVSIIFPPLVCCIVLLLAVF
jgi:hypothetical protein